jgi:hypothetical protein
MAVQLNINSDANIDGIEKARKALEQLEQSGKSSNKVFKTSGDLDAYRAALDKSYYSVRSFNDQLTAQKSAFRQSAQAMKLAQEYLGKDPENQFRYIDEQGVQQQTRDMHKVRQVITGFLDDVAKDTSNFNKSATKDLQIFDEEVFGKSVDKGANSVRMFGTELEAVQYKMSRVREQGQIMLKGGGDPKQIKALSEEYQWSMTNSPRQPTAPANASRTSSRTS